jgi:type II secretory pathway component PulK
VTALPTAVAAINICTAPAFVLESLAPNMGEYTPQVLANGRKNGCFPDMQSFTNLLGPAAANLRGRYDTKSRYFRLTTHVTLGTSEFTLYSLLMRTDGGKITPLLRSFGTP